MNRRGPANRRVRNDPEEPLDRSGRDRRREDRRDWARTVRTITVLEADGVAARHLADVSLDGVQFIKPGALISRDVEVRLKTSGGERELRLPGRVARLQPVGRATAVHVRFKGLAVADQLALARLLQRDSRRLSS